MTDTKAKEPPEEKESWGDKEISKFWDDRAKKKKKKYIPDWLKFWKRSLKKHECDWLVEVNHLMRIQQELKIDRDRYQKAFNQLNEQWHGHVCSPPNIDANIIPLGMNRGNVLIKWEDPKDFSEWLQKMLKIKRWRKMAEKEYFLKFTFAEEIE